MYSAAATDDDIGVNQNLRYSIIGGNTGGVFDITTEGNITVLQSPDRESIMDGRFTLTIQVADAGTPTLSEQGCLEVVILDCNDFPPQFVNVSSGVSQRTMCVDLMGTLSTVGRPRLWSMDCFGKLLE